MFGLLVAPGRVAGSLSLAGSLLVPLLCTLDVISLSSPIFLSLCFFLFSLSYSSFPLQFFFQLFVSALPFLSLFPLPSHSFSSNSTSYPCSSSCYHLHTLLHFLLPLSSSSSFFLIFYILFFLPLPSPSSSTPSPSSSPFFSSRHVSYIIGCVPHIFLSFP